MAVKFNTRHVMSCAEVKAPYISWKCSGMPWTMCVCAIDCWLSLTTEGLS